MEALRTALGPKLAAAWRALLDGAARGDFLGRERVVAYATAVCLGYALLVPCLWLSGQWPVGADGFPVEADFVNVWAAGFLALGGEAAAAYDWAVHGRAEALAIGRELNGYFGWHYPPMFLFAAAALALLPYVQAWLVWIAVSLFAFAGAIRLVLPGRGAVAAALAAPTTLFCALVGQNGLLTAGLMAGALALLDRRPWIAGALLGLLTYKPQYGLLFPLVLVLARRWTAFFAAASAALAFAGASALVFGAETWAAFFGSVSVSVNDVLRRGGSDWSKLQSFYALFFQATGSDAVAWAAHSAVSAGAAAAVALVWLRGAAPAVASAATMAAAFLATPYAYIYDAAILTAGAAFLAKDGAEQGFKPFDKSLLALSCCLPGLFFLGVAHSGVAPAAALTLLFLAVRRAAVPGSGRLPLRFSPGP